MRSDKHYENRQSGQSGSMPKFQFKNLQTRRSTTQYMETLDRFSTATAEIWNPTSSVAFVRERTIIKWYQEPQTLVCRYLAG
jgi:hypothetical protein